MGAKTAILAFADGDVATALRRGRPPDSAATAELVGEVFTGHDVIPVDSRPLMSATYRGDDTTYAARLPGLDIVCDRRFMVDRPSELPGRLIQLAGNRRVVLHAMHSVTDWLAFAVWEGGELVRSLSLSPDGGVSENIGEPLACEAPFWAGEQPVEVEQDEDAYPLPFHPLELGEEALRELFGFVLEGYPHPDDLDVDRILLDGFRVIDPTGAEQAERDALREAFHVEFASTPHLRVRPDGTVEIIERP